MSRTRVKICGVTRLEDALAAAELGADAIGFNFWPRSKRYCPPNTAREIARALPPFVTPVGVFVNASRPEILRIAHRVGLRAIQLHGDESPSFCARFPLPVIKAVRVEGREALRGLEAYEVEAFLLDAPSAGYGGSGRAFDWAWARAHRLPRPVILAGGLTPKNVAAAIRAVSPHAVDVASGVESAPGMKDRRKMARFIAAVQQAW